MSLEPAWHLVTGEFPPQTGGVSDYSHSVARGLAATGRSVHVWCPEAHGSTPEEPGVVVHRVAGQWRRADLERLDRAMDQLPAPRRLLVQWVPHAFGHRSLNVGFCRWVRRRAVRGDRVDVMVHEAFLAFREGSWRQDAAAVVHRVMVGILLSRATRVFVAIPAWADALGPYRWRAGTDFTWLPVPSNVPIVADPSGVTARRLALAAPGQTLVGHFGTYARHLSEALRQVVPLVLAGDPSAVAVLVGRGSEEFRSAFLADQPHLASRVRATGLLDAAALSMTLQACDVCVQPFPDGASSRRTTLMALLSHGVPTATTEGHLSEPLWRKSGAVRLAPAGEAAALARATLDLCAERDERARLGAAGRVLYAEHFDLSRTIAALVSDVPRAA